MKLNLKNPIVFFDLETTGNKYKHRQNSGNMLSEGVSKRQRRNEDHAYQSGNAHSRTILCYPRYL